MRVTPTTPTVMLRGGSPFPAIGLGTYPMGDAEAASIIPQAIDLGYRLFDTAMNYQNEEGVGKGIRTAVRSGSISREELWVTTKVPGRDHGFASTKVSLGVSLRALRLDYVDLYLIHWPNPINNRFVETWEAMVELQQEGMARTIGVSNFTHKHLERLRREVGVLPSVNQIQLFPTVPQDATRAYHVEHGIVTECWSPLGLGASEKYYGSGDVIKRSEVGEIAERHGKSPAQVILRWHVQHGFVPIPKSSKVERLKENLDVFSFALTDDDMAVIDGLTDASVEVADPNTHEEY